MKVAYEIETWTGGVQDHSITDEALSIYFKEILTSGVGHFTVTLPSKKGNDKRYDDIALNDTVKIFIGEDTLPGTANFIGKVGKITDTPVKKQWIKTVSGLSQGEILLRRFKYNKFYDGIGASTIVTEWATDLTLGAGEIAADATAVTLEVKTKSYFDLLQGISDYYDAGGSVQKDFYVDVNNNLVWKSRPIRTAGVETLTVGDNILNYAVVKSVDAVKNYITVYGAAEKLLPDDESWTEETTSWTADDGAVDRNQPGQKVGSWYIRGHTGVANSTYSFKRDIPHTTIRDISQVCFWRYNATQCDASYCRLLAPDAANYFQADLGTANDWSWKELPLGPNQIYDVNKNPNGVWTTNGSPNWWDIEYIKFVGSYAVNDKYNGIDNLYFYPIRWSDTRENPASYNAYGFRELEVTDDKLHSDADCEERARTLLSQLKDPPTQITALVKGNENILVGDRLSMTLPNEGISGVNYDVLAVEQSYVKPNTWTTKATMVNSANTREEVATNPLRIIANLHKRLKAMNLSELAVK